MGTKYPELITCYHCHSLPHSSAPSHSLQPDSDNMENAGNPAGEQPCHTRPADLAYHLVPNTKSTLHYACYLHWFVSILLLLL